ncbi:uncharacterized protein LOC112681475 [Sipha flava]|uniref:Uncharacterized protein LOC112681475 n=2 Tax=Sipha flava TaxID=143950 RepID=A0A8B8F9P9_9HEMI|nr:uncharacterized protein LOC112681475 [Sipha flava]
MNDDASKYLGIKLDRTLTYNQHLEDVKNKLKTRNNIISKLAGTSWGCRANVLRISALALVYSVAEYCAPAWERSVHTKKVDTQLNNTMRIITGCVRATNLQWLPVLSNVAPPAIRRHLSSVKLLQKINKLVNLPVYNDINNAPSKRLRSRNPIWSIENSCDSMEDMWKQHWEKGNAKNRHLISDPTQRVPGFDGPRALWTNLNRIRTEQGNCNYLLHKWKLKNSSLCDCGQIQSIKHIVEECPQTRYKGGIEGLHKGDEEAMDWLSKTNVRL